MSEKGIVTENGSKREERFKILLLCGLFLLCALPLFFPGAIRGHDSGFHVHRIEALSLAIQNGDWLPAMYPELYDGYGYALPLFYSNLLIYPFAILNAVGINSLGCFELMQASILLGTVLASFFCAKSIFKNSDTAFFCAVFYAGSTYLATDVFTRSAIGEAMVFMIAPLVLLGIWRSAFGEYRRNWPLSVGFALLALTHVLSLVMFCVLTFAFLVLSASRYVKEPKRILYFVLNGVAAVLISAFFLFPLAEQQLSAQFFSANNALTLHPKDWTVGLSNLFVTLKPEGNYTPCAGLSLLLLLALRIFVKTPRDSSGLFRNLCLLGGIFCLFMTTRFFPWAFFDPELNLLQFPWRFLLPATLFICFSCAPCLDKLLERNAKLKKTAMVVAVVAVACQFLLTARYDFYRFVARGKTYETRVAFESEGLEFVDENYLNANNDTEYWAARSGQSTPLYG